MATSRRVFLNVLSGAAATTAVDLGCGAAGESPAGGVGGSSGSGVAGSNWADAGGAEPSPSGGAAGQGGVSASGGGGGSAGTAAGRGGADDGSGGNGGGGQRNLDGGADAANDAGSTPLRDAGARDAAARDAAPRDAAAREAGGGVRVDAGPPVLGYGDRPAGVISDYANPSLRAFPEDYVAVGRDAGGLYAFTMLCSHAGCPLRAPTAAGQLSCTCHQSLFDRYGAVIRGPAVTPLERYGVEINPDGYVIVHTQISATAADRTPVP